MITNYFPTFIGSLFTFTKIHTMKKAILLLLLAIAFGCDKDDNTTTQALPPATQSGKGTFACYVDGRPFIDKSGGWFNCFYQVVDGEYYFSIQGRNENNSIRTVIIATTDKTISQGEVLPLVANQNGNAWGGGRFNLPNNTAEGSYTNSQYSGELTITKLDYTSHIVSGTFWFDVKHPITGETVEIREGRFDTLFTQ